MYNYYRYHCYIAVFEGSQEGVRRVAFNQLVTRVFLSNMMACYTLSHTDLVHVYLPWRFAWSMFTFPCLDLQRADNRHYVAFRLCNALTPQIYLAGRYPMQSLCTLDKNIAMQTWKHWQAFAAMCIWKRDSGQQNPPCKSELNNALHLHACEQSGSDWSTLAPLSYSPCTTRKHSNYAPSSPHKWLTEMEAQLLVQIMESRAKLSSVPGTACRPPWKNEMQHISDQRVAEIQFCMSCIHDRVYQSLPEDADTTIVNVHSPEGNCRQAHSNTQQSSKNGLMGYD